MSKVIRISDYCAVELKKKGKFGETYDDVIRKLIDNEDVDHPQ